MKNMKYYFPLFFMPLATTFGYFLFSGVYVHAVLWGDQGRFSVCDAERPIEITVRNMTFNSLENVELELELWQGSDTANHFIVLGQYGNIRIDRLVPSFQSETFCFDDRLFAQFRERYQDNTQGAASLLAASARQMEFWSSEYIPYLLRYTVVADLKDWEFVND
ncbi:hypothetical protein [Halocynthiibacter styelae]|uniref:Uncharacterized protein n=1 Tax=Halocynthiibacter styelae TaxID=2761955 RepID=A0A8J7ICL9_9RHOB|nr:hypothetical protein [Paenihalocynthiibacter styelae]MBI1493513.1 hypothetical protein [Paenihalocynthiibacter styelae]